MNKYRPQLDDVTKSPLYESGCLAEILAEYKRLLPSPYSRFSQCGTSEFDKFSFSIREHSTGTDVEIRCGNEEIGWRTIVSATYWYSSRYCFNESIFESGAWDSALEKAIDAMRSRVEEELTRREREETRRKEEKEQKELAEKAKFEALFS